MTAIQTSIATGTIARVSYTPEAYDALMAECTDYDCHQGTYLFWGELWMVQMRGVP